MPNVGGGENLTYKDLKTNCGETVETSEEGWQSLSDSIVILNENGSYVKDIVYVSEWLAGELELTNKGWYELDNYVDGEDYNDEPIPFGMAVQVCIPDNSFGSVINFAGEVKAAPTVTDLADFMSIANCSPKKIYAKDLVVNCGEDVETSEEGWQALSDSIVVLNENGSYVKDIVYVSEWLAGELELTTKGWYELDNYVEGEDYNESEELCWEPGAGMQICIPDSSFGETITIKSALAKDAE